MRAIVLLILAMLLPASPVWAQATERTVYASVSDKNDAPVTGLAAGEFIVREDDTAREVLRVSTATEPMHIAVLVDTSQAMEEHMLDIRTALRSFFKQMARQARDRAHRPRRASHRSLRLYARCRAPGEGGRIGLLALGQRHLHPRRHRRGLKWIAEAEGYASAHHRLCRERSRVQRAVSPVSDRRTARVGCDAAYVDAQQTGRGDGQPRRTGAGAGRRRRHEGSRADAARIC